jgi:hypothetical protein
MDNQTRDGQVERLGRSQMPFSTTDAILAFSLYMAGVPFADERRPCINIYDEDILRRMGFVGVELFEAAGVAFNKKKKGHVEYALRRTPDLRRLLNVYTDQVRELNEAEGGPVDLIKRIMAESAGDNMPLDEALLRLACINAKMKTQFMNLWQKRDPIIRIRRQGATETTELADGRTRVRKPGFVLVNLHASEKTKRKLKI